MARSTLGRRRPEGGVARRKPGGAPGWVLRLLGEPALVSPTGAEYPLERRAAALLALAWLEPRISRRRAASLLWPDSEGSNGRQALRQQLARLKRLCGHELVEGATVLNVSAHASCDIDGVEATGMLLGTFDYEDCEELARWVQHHRLRVRGEIVRRLERALDEAEGRGDLDGALERAQRLLDLDGDDERHHRSLMRLQYLKGDLAAAEGAYERLRRMLARDLGAVPSAETEELARTLRASAGARPSLASAALLRPPRLVGRSREWQALEAAWTAREAVLVTGSGGMGKTRLVTDFVATRRRIVQVGARAGDSFAIHSLLARLVRAVARCVGRPLPAGIRGELARLLPDLGDAAPVRDAGELSRLLRAVESLFELALDAGLEGLAIDDLHHADAASIEAIQATVVGERRLRAIVTGRVEEFGPEARNLADALLASTAGRAIELHPLSERDVRELIESLDLGKLDAAGLAGSVTRHTGGNPFFVLETVKAMLLQGSLRDGDAPLPQVDSVAGLIERRLALLSPRALAIARCAAIAGQDFSTELAAHVIGQRPLDLADGWWELEKANVLHGGAFAHDLVHEAARASVPGPIARRLHAEIAAFLAGSSIEPARVAEHFLAAGMDREASGALVQAAAKAREAGRRGEEAQLLESAAACFQRCDDAKSRFEALIARAEAMIVVDLGDATVAAVQAAEDAATTDEQRLRALLRKAEFLGHRSDSAAAIEAGRRGVALARKARRPDLAALFSLVVAGGLCEMRRVEAALDVLEPIRGLAEEGLEPRPRAEYFVQLGIAYDLANRLADALRAFEAARAIASQHGLRDLLATTLSNLATTNSKRGALSQAVDYGRQGLQLWRETEPLRGTPLQTQALLAHRLRDVGRYDEAIPMLEEALAAFRRAATRHWIFATAHRLALAYAHLGQHERALKLLADDPSDLPVKAQAIWMAHRAEVARLAGGTPLKPIRVALSLLGNDVDDGNNRLVSLFATPIVPPAEGEGMARDVAAWAEARERFGMAVAAHARAAGCALSLGALDRAVPHVESALALFAEHEPDNFYRPELWWVAHRVMGQARRHAEARATLAAGREWIARVASEHVPGEFRETFLRRNPVNHAILSAA